MCRAAKCPKCNKTTWTGCGAHIEQVMGSVPTAERCVCPRDTRSDKTSAGQSSLGSLLKRIGIR